MASHSVFCFIAAVVTIKVVGSQQNPTQLKYSDPNPVYQVGVPIKSNTATVGTDSRCGLDLARSIGCSMRFPR